MRAEFLLKSLDGIGNRKYITDYQIGRSNTNMHWHDCIEMVYVEKGNMKIFFDNKWHEISGGELFFVPSQRLHYMICDNVETTKMVIGVSTDAICDTDAPEEKILLPFETAQINDHCFIKDNGEIASIINRLKLNEDSYVGKLLIYAEILRIYAYVYREWTQRGLSFVEPTKDKNIYEIVHFLKRNFAVAPGAEQMAKRLGISYSYMCRILSDNLGTGYCSLLKSVRIENAKKLLLSTDKNITEIGFDCGFGDSSYFIKMFKKTVGVTPKQYRALI